MIVKFISKYRQLSEKNKIILKHTAGAFMIKGLALLLSFFTMPAYLKFFHNETALGLWFTVLSVLTWVLNFDLGIGNGLRNHLTRTLTENDAVESKRYISSAYFSIGTLVIIISAVFWVGFDFIPWNTVFNIETDIVSSESLTLAVKIVFFGIMLQFLFKLISSILYAMQKSSVNNFLSLSTSIITIICVLIIPSGSNEQNIVVMAIVHALAVLIPLLVTTIIVFCKKNMRKLIPSFKSFSIQHTKQILSLGGMFLVVQLFYMLLMNTNDYLITIFFAPEAVVDYQIYYKLFFLGSTVFSLALTPIWSAVTKAIAEKDDAWVNSLYKKLCLLAMLATFCEFMIVPFLQWGVNIWLGEEAIDTHISYAIVFAAMGSIMIWNSVFSSLANGMGKLKTQAICFGIGGVIKILLAWFFVTAFDSWIGVAVANVVSMGIYCLVEPIVIKSYLKKRMMV